MSKRFGNRCLRNACGKLYTNIRIYSYIWTYNEIRIIIIKPERSRHLHRRDGGCSEKTYEISVAHNHLRQNNNAMVIIYYYYYYCEYLQKPDKCASAAISRASSFVWKLARRLSQRSVKEITCFSREVYI